MVRLQRKLMFGNIQVWKSDPLEAYITTNLSENCSIGLIDCTRGLMCNILTPQAPA
jgi:hypothetical protein